MGTVTQTRQRHEACRQPPALESPTTARGDTARIEHRDTPTGQYCPVCGYWAVLRDGLLIHEVAALFPVILFDCDNPNNHPAHTRQ